MARITHGPEAGRLEYQSWAEEIGPIDAERVVRFIWQIAGRSAVADATWKRERPLMIALDNYWVHTSQTVEAACVQLAAADVPLVYLARYCPEQSRIEPIWNDVKQQHLPIRSFEGVADLKHAVDNALAHKAQQLKRIYTPPTNVHQRPA